MLMLVLMKKDPTADVLKEVLEHLSLFSEAAIQSCSVKKKHSRNLKIKKTLLKF